MSTQQNPDVLWPLVKAGFLRRYRCKIAPLVGVVTGLLGLILTDLLAGPWWWPVVGLVVGVMIGWLGAAKALRWEMGGPLRSSSRSVVTWRQRQSPTGTAVVRVDDRGTEWCVTFLTANPTRRGLARELMNDLVAAAPPGTRVWGRARPAVADWYVTWNATNVGRPAGTVCTPRKIARTMWGRDLPGWAHYVCGYTVEF